MQLVTILGSPHWMKGATGRLLNTLLDPLREGGAEVSTFSLAEMDVKPCKACDLCHRTGECSINDDFKRINSSMLRADRIVLASQNYISSVTAQMKALFDRCCGVLHIQALEGKYGAGLVTGGAETEPVERYILGFLRALGRWTVGSVGALAPELAGAAGEERALNSTKELGRKLITAIERRQEFPEQTEERMAFAERMRGPILSGRDEWGYEYEYWASRSDSSRKR